MFYRKGKALLLCIFILLTGCSNQGISNGIANNSDENITVQSINQILSVEEEYALPKYDGNPVTVVNGNIPYFTEDEYTTEAFEEYSDLDELGRCGTAYANICTELMPTEPRGEIGNVKPTGWHTVNYHELVDGNYLYNRCHLIGYQLAGENANEKNLITGTRFFNVEGMLPYENMVAEYVNETNNHVLYKVTPYYDGNDLVAKGVFIEASSVEDVGNGLSFNVFCFNIQPGIIIDYSNGESSVDEKYNENTDKTENTENKEKEYYINKNTKRFHRIDCKSVSDMSEKNKEYYYGTREELLETGYIPCGNCLP